MGKKYNNEKKMLNFCIQCVGLRLRRLFVSTSLFFYRFLSVGACVRLFVTCTLYIGLLLYANRFPFSSHPVNSAANNHWLTILRFFNVTHTHTHKHTYTQSEKEIIAPNWNCLCHKKMKNELLLNDWLYELTISQSSRLVVPQKWCFQILFRYVMQQQML